MKLFLPNNRQESKKNKKYPFFQTIDKSLKRFMKLFFQTIDKNLKNILSFKQ